MKSLFFWHVSLSLSDALFVTDSKGSVYYLSLGKWTSLVDLVKKDFKVVRKDYQVAPGRDSDSNSDINRAKELIKEALDRPSEIDKIRSSLLIKYIFGTASQRRVWDHLVNEIPVGKTSTYSKVAKGLGRDGGSRVIGNACGANRIALFVPCHRVLTSSQTITGYRYGPALKRSLLNQEKALS